MTQFSALLFFSTSTRSSHHLHLKSYKSSSHIHLQVIINLRIWIIYQSGSSWDIIPGSGSSLDLDHHSIWIITGSRSSLDLDHHGISSLHLDHYYWIIITGSRSLLDLDHHWQSSSWVLSHDSSHHRKFYRASPFSCWL